MNTIVLSLQQDMIKLLEKVYNAGYQDGMRACQKTHAQPVPITWHPTGGRINA